MRCIGEQGECKSLVSGVRRKTAEVWLGESPPHFGVGQSPGRRKSSVRSRLRKLYAGQSTKPRSTFIMAGIKRKSAVATPSDTKSKTKKVKVDKSAAKSSAKHEVKPAKKSKKAKVESSDELNESDTSEQENGFYGFSANEDADMPDADSSEDEDAMEDVKQDKKAHKRKSEDESAGDNKKAKSDAPDSKLAELNGTGSTQ